MLGVNPFMKFVPKGEKKKEVNREEAWEDKRKKAKGETCALEEREK